MIGMILFSLLFIMTDGSRELGVTPLLFVDNLESVLLIEILEYLDCCVPEYPVKRDRSPFASPLTMTYCTALSSLDILLSIRSYSETPKLNRSPLLAIFILCSKLSS